MQAATRYEPMPQHVKNSYATGLGYVLFLIAAVLVSLSQLAPPEPLPPSAPANEFSAGRAMGHVQAIAQRPHPIGSQEINQVRGYIIDQLTEMGLSPQVQKTTVVGSQRGPAVPAATVENIVARLDGAQGEKGIMLVAHYDSVPTGPGASDNGAGVATLLETLRALKTGPPPANSVLFLFTDGEEAGLLGARAFVEEHPEARLVSLLLNFEARGYGGPSMMFEASSGNGGLIREFAAAADYPLATSISDELYKRLPNDTDFTEFKQAGFAGLNFAYFKGINHYHTRIDSVENLDQATLQNHGSYALALARHFGNRPLDNLRDEDHIYFNVSGSVLAHYPRSWALPLMILSAIFLALVITVGIRRSHVAVGAIFFGLLVSVLTIFCATAAATGVWWVIKNLSSDFSLTSQPEPFNGTVFLLGLSGITLTVALVISIWACRKLGMMNLFAGHLLLWLLLLVASTLVLAGGSYLFAWPLLFGTLALGLLVLAKKDEGLTRWAGLAAAALSAGPAILLFIPLTYVVYLAMTLDSIPALSVLLALLSGMLVPGLDWLTKPVRMQVPAVVGLLSLGLLVAGYVTPSFDNKHPAQTNLFYAMNADTGKAVWASFDQQPDAWTGKFLTGKVERGSLSEYIPSNYGGFLKSEAPPVQIQGPLITVSADSTDGGLRTMVLRMTSPRRAPVLSVYLESEAEVVKSSVNNKPITVIAGSRWGLRYFAVPPEGVEVVLQLRSSEPVKLQAMDLSYDLPEVSGGAGAARPDTCMSSVFPYSDSTLVARSFTF